MTREWTFIDKSKWPERGPWDSEPDKIQWVDEATGLDCLAVRAISHWCGYVGVPEGHRFFGVDDNSCSLEVHGGVTFAGLCQESQDALICHIPELGRPDKVWWLGFDCAHHGDKRPCIDERILAIERRYPVGGQYRDIAYVRRQCTELAAQLFQEE